VKRIELDRELTISDADQARLDLHSFHNVLNVIVCELQCLGTLLGAPDALAPSLAICDEILGAFHDPQQARTSIRHLETCYARIRENVDQAVAAHPVAPDRQPLLDESLAMLASIREVLDVRVREILARQNAPGAWEPVRIETLVGNLRQVLDAMAQGSRGRFGVVHAPAEQGPDDYLVDVRVESVDGADLRMPPVLQDVLRDLVANARKYTDPGGCIRASLIDAGTALTLTVADNGRGVPEDELPRLVDFGYRARNARELRTLGGGYGLTKAYLVPCQP